MHNYRVRRDAMGAEERQATLHQRRERQHSLSSETREAKYV